jgi:hypothetical protein
MSLINDAAAQNYVYSDAMAENVATKRRALRTPRSRAE